MSSRPVNNAAQQGYSYRVLDPQPLDQRHRLLLGEVGELNSPSDVERRGARVPDQVRGGSDSQQAECQPLDLRIGRAPIETFADSGKELIGGKREAANGINFVHKYDDPALANRQDGIGEDPHETAHWPILREAVPALFHFIFESKLLARAFNESVVPLLGRQILTQTRQVQHGDPRTAIAQAGRSPHHERRLPHLPGREQVTDFSRLQRCVKDLVGPSFNVGRRIPAEGSADDKEAGR